ncbi:MAG TPA: carboxypeptidase-like regulatory domain-containing protein, partial [Pilimelia sp.]|nr:carboxypeptidase-like regulatory domain-containing protein [Pilimelia sp.]
MRRERRWHFALSLIVLLLTAVGPAEAGAAAADTGTLVVTLRDTDGTPLRLADVKVFDAEAESVQYESFTDDDGRAVFDDMSPGGYTVFFVVEGLRMWAESAEDGDTATVYQVPAGGQVAVAPRLLPHARIAGTLTDAGGGVAWGEMIASPVGTFGARVNEVTDFDGRAAVRVAPGVYRVGFTTDTISQWVPGRPSPHGAHEFALAAGDRVAVAESLPETGRVVGTVVDAAGKPVLGATVRLHQGAYETNRERTNRQGEFVMSRVRAGSYTVSVTSPRGSTQWLPGRATAEEAQPVAVGSAAEVRLDEALLPTGDIVGTLHGRDGAPTSHGWIFARPVPDTGGEALISATPDREGRYRLTGLAAGRYRLGFEIDGRRQYLGGHGAAAASAPVTVPAGETLTLDERAAAGRPVTLRAVDAGSGKPVREFCALLVGPDDERLPDTDIDKYPHGCTDDATLTLPDVLPGRYEAHLRTPRPSGWLPASAAVDVPASGPAEAQLTLARGGTVHVRVVARPAARVARAVSGASVHLVPEAAGAAVPAPLDTDDKGTATFVGVPDGRYRIFVEPRGDALGRQWVGANRGVGAAHLAASVPVRAGQTTYPPVVRLDRAG